MCYMHSSWCWLISTHLKEVCQSGVTGGALQHHLFSVGWRLHSWGWEYTISSSWPSGLYIYFHLIGWQICWDASAWRGQNSRNTRSIKKNTFSIKKKMFSMRNNYNLLVNLVIYSQKISVFPFRTYKVFFL